MEMEVLLTPLAAHAPCGDDLSFSSEFDTINEMRRADDATLNQGEWVTSLKVADWPGVARTCRWRLPKCTVSPCCSRCCASGWWGAPTP